jgi:hypothetical protein
MRSLFLLLIGLGCFSLSQAQKITLRKLELVNDHLVVHYEIDDSNFNNEYAVSLYTSKDNFSAPVTKVSGDIGQEVKPGERQVTWAIREEYGDYKGPLSVELRANVYIPFVRLKTFITSKGYSRGKAYPLEWRPGNTNPVHIELFKEDQRLQGELNHPNSGYYNVNFASRLKPGKGYRIKLTDSKHPDDFAYSQKFKVRRKVPLLVKVLPLLVGGYFAVQLLESGSSENSLPDPPKSPTTTN